MTYSTDNNHIQISKLKGAQNFHIWAVYVQATLESRNVWKIVTGAKVVPIVPTVCVFKTIKALYTSFI